MTEEKVVLERKPYEPRVVEKSGELIYCLPVESGLASKVFRFAITPDQLTVLSADEERYYFLFAVLHQRFQMRSPASAPDTDQHFDLVLFGTIPEVERLLSLLDAYDGSVSNLVRLTMGRDSSEMREGRWFIGK